MCGIVGTICIDLNGEALKRVAEDMQRQLAHRGPDDYGVWVDAECGVAFAHRRLSIVDLSPAGHQPMVSGSGRFVLTFNGEIYNHSLLREALAASGASIEWRGHSDTETLLAHIEHFGLEKTLESARGMFAFGLWDRANQTLFLVRDRAGEKPLYYGWCGGSFAFASELKALKVHPEWNSEIDRGALALLLRHNYIPAPFSIYGNISKLSPGSILRLSRDDVRRKRQPSIYPYWSLLKIAATGARAPFLGTDHEAVAKLETLAGDAIQLQQLSDVPLGAFLSGGIDSSLIVALMREYGSGPVHTFTIGFEQREYNEAPYARAVARHLGTHHTELIVSAEQAMSIVARIPQIYDEPFSDSSQIATVLVAELAQRHVKVSLSGDGGDELFGGYNRYFMGRTFRKSLRWLPLPVRRAIAQAVEGCSPSLLNAVLRPLGTLAHSLRVAQPSDKAYKAAEVFALPDNVAVYRRLVSHWDSPEDVIAGVQEPPTTLDRLLGRSDIANSFEQWMMTADAVTYLPDDVLAKVDRAAMCVSLETRAPYLDHRLMEFAFSLPLSMKIRGGRGKWLLRELLKKYVPEHLMDRPKMGFAIPIDDWLRGPLREWAEELLSPSRLKREQFFDPSAIRKKWLEHVTGRRNWQHHLWDILMFQSWLEHQKGDSKLQYDEAAA
jgi:asparagine synthase (glutamine-hydrolysing)